MPISDHVGVSSRSVVNLNTFALIVYVVSSSSSPSPSPPWSPGDGVRANPSSSNEPSVAGVSLRDTAEEDGSRNADTALAGAGALAFVDAGVESAVPPAVPPAGAAGPKADVDPKLKTEPGAAVDVVACDEVREGEPNEKPTLPALGGGDDPLPPPPGAMPKPKCAGVAADAAEPKANVDDFEGTPNGAPPNTLLGGTAAAGLSFSSLCLLSFSSADFVVVEAPNMLLEPDELVLVPPKRFAPGGREKANGPGWADEAGLSLSLSFPSGGTLSEPKSGEVFGGLPKSKVLVVGRPVPPVLLPPREKAFEVLVDENAPKEGGFSEGGLDSASFDVWDADDLNGESEDTEPKPGKGEDEAADTGLGSEDAGVVDERLKGDGLVEAAGLGVNPVAGAGESRNGPKPEKPDGGTGIVAGVEPGGLRNEIGAAGTVGLLGGLGALCVLA
jgi:hypothetical protein